MPSNMILPQFYTTLSRAKSSEIGGKVALNYLPPWDSLEGVFGFYLLRLSNFIQVSILLGSSAWAKHPCPVVNGALGHGSPTRFAYVLSDNAASWGDRETVFHMAMESAFWLGKWNVHVMIKQLLGCVRRSQEIKTDRPALHLLWFKVDTFVTKGLATLISTRNMQLVIPLAESRREVPILFPHQSLMQVINIT